MHNLSVIAGKHDDNEATLVSALWVEIPSLPGKESNPKWLFYLEKQDEQCADNTHKQAGYPA